MHMKHLLAFLLLLTSLFITSCSSSDPDSDLQGVWEVTSGTLNCPSIGQIIPDVKDGCLVIEGEELCMSLTFMENGVGRFETIISDLTETGDFTYTINEDIVSLCVDSECNNLTLRENRLILEQDIEGCDLAFILSKR